MMSADDASSSYSSSMVSSKEYDVFLSFRGEDTRRNFTGHLHNALNQKSVKTFIDYQLEKGDEISPALIKAIKDSHVSIVILSENYASSKWCLEELSMIMECRENQGQSVIPVFYEIDPSHVRRQKESYERAFAKHEGDDRCNKWKDALTEVANLAGWDSRGRKESKLVKKIVGGVLAVLQKLTPRCPNQFEKLVGMEYHYEQIESLLKNESGEFRTLGIWGIGGIGKTTLATALYAKLSHEFEGSCFLANVREESKHGSLEALGNKLFSKLLEEENHWFDAPMLVSDSVKRRLARKKVLIVLDDVDSIKQLEFLIKCSSLLRPGSRIIVTTRNKQIFHQLVEVYYELKELSFHHSLQLFCLTVYGEEQPKLEYKDLSNSVIFYCRGNPLALTVVGASLRGRSIEAWQSELKKLEAIPNTDIQNVLKLSYEGLDDDSQRDIFLDIACFFDGESGDLVTSVLKCCHFSVAHAIEILLDKGLISYFSSHYIKMHDLIKEMGREIVRQESIKDPGRRTRIWKHEEVLDVLKNNSGTDAVEGLTLNLRDLNEDLSLRSNTFAKMTKMRFFKIHDSFWYSDLGGFNVYLPDGLESFSNKLSYLQWHRCSLESLPPNFCAEKLVELRMPYSKLKKLWKGVQDLVNLKVFDLRGSRDLVEIPNLSKAIKLEEIILASCESLGQLHPSMLRLPRLTFLNLEVCRKIEILNVYSESPLTLYLSSSSIKDFSVISEKTELHLSCTRICILPPALIQNLPLLTFLGFAQCTEFVSFLELPPSLKTLHVNHCMKLVSLPELPPSLKELQVNHCMKLVSLPQLTEHLEVVDACECTSLETIFTQDLVLQHLLQSRIPFLHKQYLENPHFEYFIFPGDHITDEYGFRTTDSSITIPCLPLSHLCGFIFCTILSRGWCECNVSYSIDHDGKDWGGYKNELFIEGLDFESNHLLFWYVEKWDTFSDTPFKFEFDYWTRSTSQGSEESIKECGVFPVYASESESGSSLFVVTPRKLESITQISNNEKEDSEQLLPACKRRRISP